MKKIIFSLLAMLFLVQNVCAETELPNGAVKGLPQNLLVLDEAGNSPKDGELYIYIEDMVPREVYTKDITLMNARDDAIYSIYMTAAPNYTDGEVDLLSETSCKLWLDDELIFEGRVDGEGTPSMHGNGIDLGGKFESGETRHLHAEFCWNITEATENMINQYSNDNKDYYGEVSFKWIFYASIPHGGVGRNPGGGSRSAVTKETIEYNTETESETKENTEGETSTGDGIGEIVIPNQQTDENGNGTGGNSIGGNGTEKGDNEDDKNKSSDTDKFHNDRDEENPDEDEDEDNSNKGGNPDDKPGEGFFDKVANKLPFVPKDVKTGYHSELVLYTKIACGAFAFAVLILIMLGYNWMKLKKLKDKSYE